MADPKALAEARAALAKNRADALKLHVDKGLKGARAMLERAAKDLEARLAKHVVGEGDEPFSIVQMRVTLAQVKLSIVELNKGLKGVLVDGARDAAGAAAQHTADYLAAADEAFRGVGTQPLALNEARMVDVAVQGSQASILRRLASSGKPASRVGRLGELVEPHPAKLGILQRYGMQTLGAFEETLQRGVVARKSFDEMREDITARSPFLQGAPKFWAERIVRTECMGAYNRGAFEATRVADDELGDVVKILVATFDDRTACLLGSARLTGAVVRAVFRRWYEGDIVHLATEGGRQFTATPNHPVLTRRGWIAAGELREGDDLVCRGGEKYARAARHEHVEECPPTIGEVFDALLLTGRVERRRGAEPDFHGDGSPDHEVEVLWPYADLRVGDFAAFSKHRAELIFSPTDAVDFCGECGALFGPDSRATRGRLRACAKCDAGIDQASRNRSLRSVEPRADAFDRFARTVSLDDIVDVDVVTVPRVLSLVGEEESKRGGVVTREAARGDQLRDVAPMRSESLGDAPHREATEVEFDRLVFVEVSSFCGHVFNLTTEDGYFVADGVYTSNCDSYAVHGQIRRPDEPFDTWTGQVQHPPARPNDREVVVTHRIAWEIPPELKPRSPAEIAAKWAEEHPPPTKKGAKAKPMPPIPLHSTVPLDQFGKPPPKAKKPEPPREARPPREEKPRGREPD